ncbi:MAG: hypothetical protein ACPGVS_10560, partial [Primorskyibacter sp.]
MAADAAPRAWDGPGWIVRVWGGNALGAPLFKTAAEGSGFGARAGLVPPWETGTGVIGGEVGQKGDGAAGAGAA